METQRQTVSEQRPSNDISDNVHDDHTYDVMEENLEVSNHQCDNHGNIREELMEHSDDNEKNPEELIEEELRNGEQKFTNFFMDEILKPEFGQKRCVDTKLFTSLHSERRVPEKDLQHSSRDEIQESRSSLTKATKDVSHLWPAWVYCTRYSDRPSSGPRTRKMRKERGSPGDKRPRTAFTDQQLHRLRREFETCKYLTEEKRRVLADELQLKEVQIKIWFQNKRAKLKKASGVRNDLALQLMAEGLYNHSTTGNSHVCNT